VKTSETATPRRWPDAIELEADLGNVDGERSEQAAELGLFSGLLEEPVSDDRECFDAFAVAVFDHEFEAAGLTQATDRRGLEHDGHGASDFLENCGLKLGG